MRPRRNKTEKLDIAEQRQNLPICRLKEELLETIADNQITIVVGETGSGKSTQLTQYLEESRYGLFGKICCTQPRCVAAVSLAERVAQEYGCEIGKTVGYSIRFCDMTSEETVIQYMTDGVLLRKCKSDPDFLQYSVIILDEAHERTVHTDILFALLKCVVTQRPNFKLIVTSATLDAGKFSEYFFNAPVFTIPGRTYPVEIVYYPKKKPANYFDASIIKVIEIHVQEEAGDILLFFPGEKEIMKACRSLEIRARYFSKKEGKLLVLPIYSALPTAMQASVFKPAPDGCRKVVVATNIAETSLTIDGISYVIDPGYVKNMTYDPRTGQQTLDLHLISQAQAKQRTGRAGRTGPGKCYRLYTKEDYEKEMLPATVPVIKSTNLIGEILQLKCIGVDDLLRFDFMDAPPTKYLTAALKELQSLLALDRDQNITELGELMCKFPLIPNLSKALINSIELGCSDEMLVIASLMSSGSVFYRPMLNESFHKEFHLPEGDHLTLLKVYNDWKDNDFSSSWCYENKIHEDNLVRARNVREQLQNIMTRQELSIVSCHGDHEKIEKAFCSGFFENVALRQPTGLYKTLKGNKIVKIHPSSALCRKNFDMVVYKDLMKMFTTYITDVVSCKSEWLDEFRNISDHNLTNSNVYCEENHVEFLDLEDFSTNVNTPGGSSESYSDSTYASDCDYRFQLNQKQSYLSEDSSTE